MDCGTEQRRYDGFGNASQTTTTSNQINPGPSSTVVMKYT